MASLARPPHVPARSHVSVAYHARPEVFSDYYQLGGNGESDEAESEPFMQRELKGYTEGPHSPFGLVWQVATATGWSIDYILWKVPYPMLLLMAKDASRYVSAEEQKKRQYKEMMKKMQKSAPRLKTRSPSSKLIYQQTDGTRRTYRNYQEQNQRGTG